MNKKPRAIGSLLVCACLFWACTGRPPQIFDLVWRIDLLEDHDQGLIYERLSLFVQVYDADGFDELQYLYLIHDEQELFWELQAESWLAGDDSEQRWIGSNALCMPDFSSLPRGIYRVLIQDLGGDAAESEFAVATAPTRPAEVQFPRVSAQDGKIQLAAPFQQFSIWVYDTKISYRASYDSQAGMVDAEVIRTKHRDLLRGFHYFTHVDQEAKGYGLISGPYYYEGRRGR